MSGPSREEFLRLTGNAVLAVSCGGLLLGGYRSAVAQTAGATPAPDFGVSSGNSGSTNHRRLVEALSNSGTSVSFPPGDYRLDNSSGGVTIRSYSGEMTMENGARFLFEDKTRRGIVFDGGTGARFRGIRSTFVDGLPSARAESAACWLFENTSDTYVEGADLDGSAGAGMLFWRCDSPRVVRASIRNTMADGLHYANCRDGSASDVVTDNSGDDGVAFVNYASGPDSKGGRAENIVVKRSHSRGIAVVGQSDVTVDGFDIDGTAVTGVYVAQENSFRTRVPRGVTVKNGKVNRAGQLQGYPGSRHGIGYENVGSVTFENISVSTPRARGVSGVARSFGRVLPDGSTVQEPEGVVALRNVRIYNVPEAGFDLQGGRMHLDNLYAKSIGRTGFFIADASLVNYGKLVANGASMRDDDSLARGFSFENNARVTGGELWLVDGRQMPTGFVVNTSGRQSGRLGRIVDRVAARQVSVHNNSRLPFSR